MESYTMTAFTLDLNPIFHLNSDQFYELCRANPDLKLEQTAQGELVLMPPTGGETGRQNFKLGFQFGIWNEKHQRGECFDSSTGFILPNKAMRSPDISWVEKSRWAALTTAEKTKFIPLCPDFVLELVSPSDIVHHTCQKMQEYMENGCRLGWLINRQDQQLEIYRPGQPVEILDAPLTVSGEAVLQGFELNLSNFWE